MCMIDAVTARRFDYGTIESPESNVGSLPGRASLGEMHSGHMHRHAWPVIWPKNGMIVGLAGVHHLLPLVACAAKRRPHAALMTAPPVQKPSPVPLKSLLWHLAQRADRGPEPFETGFIVHVVPLVLIMQACAPHATPPPAHLHPHHLSLP